MRVINFNRWLQQITDKPDVGAYIARPNDVFGDFHGRNSQLSANSSAVSVALNYTRLWMGSRCCVTRLLQKLFNGDENVSNRQPKAYEL